MTTNTPINIKGERRSCFNCNYEAMMRRTRCPRCGGKTHTRTKIRVYGVLLLAAGGLLTLVFAAIFIALAMIAANPAEYGVKIPASEKSRLLVILATLGAGAALGAALGANGVWQIFFGRGNLFLGYAAIALIFLVVVGTVISFGVQSNYAKY